MPAREHPVEVRPCGIVQRRVLRPLALRGEQIAQTRLLRLQPCRARGLLLFEEGGKGVAVEGRAEQAEAGALVADFGRAAGNIGDAARAALFIEAFGDVGELG